MKKELKKEILSYLIIIAVVIIIRTFFVTPVKVKGTSMEPTLKENEIMILNKITYRFNDIKRFDIVVVKENGERLIKRVIGLPGETISWENNNLFIDGKLFKENYLVEETADFDEKEITKDCYFLVGDNRDVSLDSRYFGCFKKEEILGKASLVIFPFKEFGIKE